MELFLLVLTFGAILASIGWSIFTWATKDDSYYHEDINVQDVIDYMESGDCTDAERAAIAKAVMNGVFRDDRDNT